MARLILEIACRVPRFFRVIIKILVFATALWIFTQGFLLTRHELPPLRVDDNQPSNQDSLPPRKIIFLVIDALRYDFALFDPQLNPQTMPPYRNRLKILHDLATRKGCSKARLFRFQADAPTTTMQRIKGLTTGAFPTFIDLSRNFDSSEITEDNLIDKLTKESGYNITLLGDDTWLSLFPRRFQVSHAFPSFDVKDLHTVDNGIMSHLASELGKPNWQLLIAHFLGVDHCGHRYGPNHPEMKLKLEQMNKVIETIVESMDENTLLLILGDHGMTQTGDHGGESDDETNAALFAYSPTPAFNGMWRNEEFKNKSSAHDNHNMCQAGLVQQIDLVPTISTLIKSGIPSSNLGSIITDLLPTAEGSLEEWNDVSKNARQILDYLTTYNSQHSLFSDADMEEINDKFTDALDADLSGQQQLKASTRKLLHVMIETRERCRSLWAQFDIALMTIGLGVFAAAASLLLCSVRKAKLWFAVTAICACVGIYTSSSYLILTLQCIILSLCALISPLQPNTKKNSLPPLTFPLVISVLVVPFCLTSNSYVINEDDASVFFYVSALLWTYISTLKCQVDRYGVPTKRFNPVGRSSKRQSVFTYMRKLFLQGRLMGVLGLILVARFCKQFFICRPEQTWCYSKGLNNDDQPGTHGIAQEDQINQPSTIYWRLGIGFVSLVVFTYSVKNFIRNGGNARKALSAPSTAPVFFIPIAALFTFVHWAVQAGSTSKTVSVEMANQLNFIPLTVYVMLFLSVVWWLLSPVDVHLMYPDRYGKYHDQRHPLSRRDLLRMYYQVMSNDKTSAIQGTPSGVPPAAFGLYTLVSAAMIGIGQVVLMFAILLSDLNYAPVYVMLMFSVYILLELISSHEEGEDFSLNDSEEIRASWSGVACWVLSCTFWWFATGHQTSISSIPWDSAYVGYQGSHKTVWIPALMVGTNVFASQILHTIMLPLVLLWPISRASLFMDRKKKKFYDSEHVLLLSKQFRPALEDLIIKHLTLHGFKLLGCLVSAYFHRRHLMVWKIFAPRFIYEVVSFVVISFVSIIVYAFMLLFGKYYQSWIDTMNDANEQQFLK